MNPAIEMVLVLTAFFGVMALPLVLRDAFTRWRDNRRLRKLLLAVPDVHVLGMQGVLRRWIVLQMGPRRMLLRADRVRTGGVTAAGMVLRLDLVNPVRSLSSGLAQAVQKVTEGANIGDLGATDLNISWTSVQDIEGRLTWAAGLKDAVDLGSPWGTCARRLGLMVNEDGQVVGEIEGVPVGARLTEEGVGQLRVPLSSPVRAAHREVALPGAQPTGNVLVDQLLKVSGSVPDGWFEHPERVEALLEVLHGYPGSRLHPEGVTLVMPRLKLDIEPELRKLVRLAKLLER